MKIVIETIPMNEQRYNTCGDWKFAKDGKDTTLTVKVSEFPDGMRNSKYLYEALVGIHELVEAISCEAKGISQKQVDDFDIERDEELKEMDIEPGDHPEAPYREQHCLATGIERILCAYFNIDWQEYEDKLIEMTEAYDAKKN